MNFGQFDAIKGKRWYWLFLALFLVSASVCIYALRQNNQRMVDLREKVYQADKEAGNIESALAELRHHVHSHMNTDLSSGGNAIKPPIQLKYTYERLIAAERDKANKSNEELYTKAQEYCQARFPSSFTGGPRVPCIEEYVTANGIQPDEIEISTALYKFDFVSPRWSPDLAGWSLIASVIFFGLFLAGLLMDRLVGGRIRSQDI